MSYIAFSGVMRFQKCILPKSNHCRWRLISHEEVFNAACIVVYYAGDKDADNRCGAICVLLASTADLQPVVRDLSTNQHVSS